MFGRGGRGRRDGTDFGFTSFESRFAVPRFSVRQTKQVEEEVAEARKLGREHGRVGVPGLSDHDSAIFSAYRQRAEETMSMVSQAWSETWRQLRGGWCKMRHVADAADKRAASLGPGLAKLDKRLLDAERAYDKRRAERDQAGAAVRFRMGRTAYILTMLLIFLVDAPLNTVAFQVFVSSTLEAFLLGALLGVIIVLPAHFLGIQLRSQMPDKTVLIGATAIPGLFTLALALARTRYLSSVGQKPFSGWLGIFVFTVMNLAIFSAGVFASYLRHDPFERALDEAAREVKQAKTERDALAQQIASARAEAEAARMRAAELRAWGDAEHEKARGWAEAERNFFEGLMQEYRAANQVHRANPGDVIRALEEWQKPTMPSALVDGRVLDWACAEWDEQGL